MPSINLRHWTKAGATFAAILVRDAQGVLVSTIPITGQQYAGLSAGGTAAAVALGVSKGDWESGRAVAYGHGMSPGDVQMQRDGKYRVKLADGLRGAEMVQDFLDVPAALVPSGVVGTLSVSPAALALVDKSGFRIVANIDSVVNGVLTWR